MFDEATLRKFFEDRGIQVSGRIAEDIFKEFHFYVFVDVTKNKENLQVPSNRVLNEAKDFLESQAVFVDYILTDATGHDMESGYRASMLHSFGDYIRNAFLTIDGGDAVAWIVPKVATISEIQGRIEERSRIFLENYDLNLKGVDLTSAANLPGKLAFLQAVRSIAPALTEEITQALQQKSFTVPSHTWTNHMLDNLRKSGFVVRFRSGRYVLTLAGLKALGTTKTRRSPDISRMLALARWGD